MNELEDLPQITGGSDKQQMFAESIRLQFIALVEDKLPNFREDFNLVLDLRTDYRWWLDRSGKVDFTTCKYMISAAKTAVKKHGSMQAAKEAQELAIKKQREHWEHSQILGGIFNKNYRNPNP